MESLGGSSATASSRASCNSSCSACRSEAFLSSLPASSTSSLRLTCSSRILLSSSSTSSFWDKPSSSSERARSISLSIFIALSCSILASAAFSGRDSSIRSIEFLSKSSGFLFTAISKAFIKRFESASSFGFPTCSLRSSLNCSSSTTT